MTTIILTEKRIEKSVERPNPRYRVLATVYAIGATLLTVLPAVYGHGGLAEDLDLKMYHLVGFSPVGMLFMLAPLMVMVVYHVQLAIEKKLILYFVMTMAAAGSYMYCLEQAVDWMRSLSGRMPDVDTICIYYFFFLAVELILVIVDSLRKGISK